MPAPLRPLAATLTAALLSVGSLVSATPASAAPAPTRSAASAATTTAATSTAATSTAAAASASAPTAATARKAFRGKTQHGSFTSRYWPGRTVHWRAAVPVGVPKGTVIVLHGMSDYGDKAFDGLDLRAQARRTGMAIVTVDGGDHFWTNHGNVDTGRMVTGDLVNALRTRGLPVDRYALSGYSMGGTGAMLIAQRVGSKRVFAVAPMSAAVWQGGKSGVEAHAQSAVRRQAARLRGIPTRIVCGTGDSLLDVNRSMARLVPHASTSWTAGAHDFDYWRPVFAQQLNWIVKQTPRS
ncbi:enterochelin esterase-like enzyme [Kineosphaera limosa]|uniref:Esterase n=1 Tax=Kineosphaera limosa NBRC 100340 TaxID=1184609 RepID=K6WSG3_9MICO|nr:alpha/beta hydrolase-fold protein [Kineosphaera limosa]NYE00487.1 enterochelin esterase-like enzyme [Kineosphaera limosa]GAB95047.1 hypothetical protein KILIM_015_01090 [Kineosphaera limosa NBRC 100340]